jgi:hypothetical protein
LTSNPARGEQSKTVVDARYQTGVKGRLREFAQHRHPDFTTTTPKLPKLFVSSKEPHHWKGENPNRRKALRGRRRNSAPSPSDCNHSRWYLMMNDPAYDAVSLQLTKALHNTTLGNSTDGAPNF